MYKPIQSNPQCFVFMDENQHCKEHWQHRAGIFIRTQCTVSVDSKFPVDGKYAKFVVPFGVLQLSSNWRSSQRMA